MTKLKQKIIEILERQQIPNKDGCHIVGIEIPKFAQEMIEVYQEWHFQRMNKLTKAFKTANEQKVLDKIRKVFEGSAKRTKYNNRYHLLISWDRKPSKPKKE